MKSCISVCPLSSAIYPVNQQLSSRLFWSESLFKYSCAKNQYHFLTISKYCQMKQSVSFLTINLCDVQRLTELHQTRLNSSAISQLHILKEPLFLQISNLHGSRAHSSVIRIISVKFVIFRFKRVLAA